MFHTEETLSPSVDEFGQQWSRINLSVKHIHGFSHFMRFVDSRKNISEQTVWLHECVHQLVHCRSEVVPLAKKQSFKFYISLAP